MAPTASLSVGCVEKFLQSNMLDDHDKYTVQVLEVKIGITKKGGKKYTLTISDGVHCLGCLAATQMYQLLESIVTKYSVVLPETVILNECTDGVQVLAVQMSQVSNCEESTDDDKQEEVMHSQKRTEVYQGWENCGNIPCDWTVFGPTIISHLNEDYVGCLVDSNCQVIVEDYEDGKCDIKTNKQLIL
jgi:hypothetical protein